ncbi:hypothetical protein LBMAG42_45020 [Deltaproteobacteria bacterium]|nr:hypothetical protein LBMAG42_45020 [Deltaproteobacteria bacterium]
MVVVVFAILGSLLGCGPTCRTTCETLYGSGQDQCNINVPDFEGEEGANRLIVECQATCEEAMTNTGTVGTYDPNSNTDTKIDIANEKQAALWMDCVATTSCDNMDKGFCQPHY